MLTNKQIRVGNIIASGVEFKTTSCIGKVLSIGNDEQEFEQVYCEENEAFSWFFKDSYCGIPINENILKFLGFEQKNETYTLGDCIISSQDEKFYYNIDKSFNKEIKFIHDIQNLYYLFNGKEINIDNMLSLNYDEY